MRAGSPQRFRALVEALRPCGLEARSDSKRGGWQPAAIKTVFGGLEADSKRLWRP